jgi:hypothetical protein
MAGLMLKKEKELSHGLDRMKCRDTQISWHSCKESGSADLRKALYMCRPRRGLKSTMSIIRGNPVGSGKVCRMKRLSTMKLAKVMVEMDNDEAWRIDVNFEHSEFRDTQISCIAARSLVEPPKACRP